MACLGAEQLGELGVDIGLDPRCGLVERAAGDLGGLLELGLDDFHLGAGLLAVEDPAADPDRVVDELGGIGGLARQANSRVVVDHEAVDVQAVADDANLGEGERCRCFHGYPVAPWQADLTERMR